MIILLLYMLIESVTFFNELIRFLKTYSIANNAILKISGSFKILCKLELLLRIFKFHIMYATNLTSTQ